MHQTYPTDIFRERQLTLLREAEERRLVRQLRAARLRGHSRSERRMAGFWRAIALWGRARTPFFRA